MDGATHYGTNVDASRRAPAATPRDIAARGALAGNALDAGRIAREMADGERRPRRPPERREKAWRCAVHRARRASEPVGKAMVLLPRRRPHALHEWHDDTDSPKALPARPLPRSPAVMTVMTAANWYAGRRPRT